MSTEQPRYRMPENAPELLSTLDTATTLPPDGNADTSESEPTDDAPRRGGAVTAGLTEYPAPHKSSSDLGGQCPACGSLVDTRLRITYDDSPGAHLQLYGRCRGDCEAVIVSDDVVTFSVEVSHL